MMIPLRLDEMCYFRIGMDIRPTSNASATGPEIEVAHSEAIVNSSSGRVEGAVKERFGLWRTSDGCFTRPLSL